jgi:pimeloyl-ACP methyl ester carboxylesterase
MVCTTERTVYQSKAVLVGPIPTFEPCAANSSQAFEQKEIMAPGTVVIPNAGHWLMEEQPAATITAIRTFLDTKK